MTLALNLDSCYIVIRNRVKEDLDSDVVDLSVERICKPITLFLFWGTFRKMTSLRITIQGRAKDLRCTPIAMGLAKAIENNTIGAR